jgi:hypothetical protein
MEHLAKVDVKKTVLKEEQHFMPNHNNFDPAT